MRTNISLTLPKEIIEALKKESEELKAANPSCKHTDYSVSDLVTEALYESKVIQALLPSQQH